MAHYNTRRTYNKQLPSGGANYNSAPFAILVLDHGSSVDTITNIVSNIDISDNATTDDNIALIASVDILDKSNFTSDNISITHNIAITDNAIGHEILSVMANLKIEDAGIGYDFDANIAGAFFVIDSENILHPLGVLVTNDSRYELLPATRDMTEEIPGRHGEIDFGTEFKTRPLELHVATDEGYTPLEKSHLQRLFAKYLDPTKGYKTLIFSDDVEKTYMVKYSGKIDISNHPSWFQFVLPFKMQSPFIIGSFEKTHIGSGTIVNEGTYETGLIIEIIGPITNPTLIIGGETISYSGSIENGQKLVIDTEKETVKIGSTNAIENYNGVFPLLYPGETNVVASNNIIIKWRDKWL